VTKQLKEVAGIFTDAAAKIDRQVKAYDEERKAARLEEIRQIYEEEIGDMADIIPFDKLYRAEWVNKTTTDKTVRGDIQTAVINAQTGIEQIKGLGSPHENAILSAFLYKLSLADALAAKKRLEDMDAAMKRRQEETVKTVENVVEAIKEAVTEPVYVKDEPLDEDGMDFTFTVKNATQAHLEALTAFLEENGFDYTLEV
jgi:hypothetical protein